MLPLPVLVALGLAAAMSANAQAGGVPAGPAPVVTGSGTLRGVDPSSGIRYALVPVSGKLITAVAPGQSGQAGQPDPPPRLTAQCTESPDGKAHFELLADAGGVSALRFFPPWHATPGDLFPPRLEPVVVTLEFLGYTRVKPARRVWVRLLDLSDELRYATPGLSSPNMETIQFYLQYLRALPTLRLTWSGRTVEFATADWLVQLRAEPLCRSSGL